MPISQGMHRLQEDYVLTLSALSLLRLATSLSAAAWAACMAPRVAFRLSHAVCRAVISECAACTHTQPPHQSATLPSICPLHGRCCLHEGNVCEKDVRGRRHLLVALVALQAGLMPLQGILGGLQLLRQDPPLALALSLGAPKLHDLHIIRASGWAGARQRVMSPCNLTVHSHVKRLQEAWQQWMVHQPLHAGLSVRAGLSCYYLCVEVVYLQLKLVSLHIQIPQLAAFLQSY